MPTHLIRYAVVAALIAACTPPPAATPEPATSTPEIFIALTQAMPARVKLNDTELAVESAALDVCDLPACPQPADGTRFLRVTLQVIGPASNQSLDGETLPDGIAIHDDTGAITAFDRLSAYSSETGQLRLYFMVPTAAGVFGLQWPGTAEIPLTVQPVPR